LKRVPLPIPPGFVMLSDRDALVAAICANPEEDTPRLMFADWLDEHGAPERAEFIRLQCEQARLADDGSDSQPVYEFLRDRDYVTRPSADWTRIDDDIHRRIALAMRADDLLRRFGEGWVPKLPKRYQLQWNGFHRGFPHRLELGTWRKKILSELAPRLRGAVPAFTLVVADHFNDWSVEQLADAGLLGHISGLDLGADCWAGLSEFGGRPEAAAVRSLKVRFTQYANGTELASALADAPHWTGLRVLDLSETVLDAAACETVLRAKHLSTLRRLYLRGMYDWTPDTVRALAVGRFPELTSLSLSGVGNGGAVAEALASSPCLTRLRRLDLPGNDMHGRGVTALLASSHLANVAYLGLENNRFAERLDAKRLAAAEPGGLRMLHCHGCRLRTADVRALARCPRLRTLWYLDLDDTEIGTPAVRELVRGFGKWCPPILWMTHNRIDDRGAELLAKWKAASALRILHLKYNPLTGSGVRALLNSPNLANLDGLGVPEVDLATTARLRARFRYYDIHY
jgi:uncharacterized protein (TIGR02996 family)